MKKKEKHFHPKFSYTSNLNINSNDERVEKKREWVFYHLCE